MNRRRPFGLLAGCTAALLGLATAASGHGSAALVRWSDSERAVLASMTLDRLPAPPADPSNRVEGLPGAHALGRRLFFDTRLSGNGQVSCATCHLPEQHFQDGRPVGRGAGTGVRRTMSIAAAAHAPWLFWDGRKDSLWSQALGPLEDPVEHGANRVQLVRVLAQHYKTDYEALFGPLPGWQWLQEDASPLGTPAQQQAWQRIPADLQHAVNRAFANLGKAIAAYERSISPREGRFDHYVRAVLAGDPAGQQVLSSEERQGLTVFLGKGQCATCHNGPLFTDQHFHNTGVPPRPSDRPDAGRGVAITRAQADEFNCLGRYSDAPANGCAELRFIAGDDPRMTGAFKTPSLRNVANRAPYMHAGQLETLEQVVEHYRRSPPAAVGHSELARGSHRHAEREPIRLDAQDARDLVAFLHSLTDSSAIDQAAAIENFDSPPP